MPEILIVSDSHGMQKELIELASRHHDVDAYVHCGDSELPADAEEMKAFVKVGGNVDQDPSYPEEVLLERGGLKLFASHGHLHNVKTTMLPFVYRAKEKSVHVACFGHTHIAGAEKVDDVLLINPGSIQLSKGDMEETYAILDWNGPEDIKIAFHALSGEIVDERSL